MKRFLIVVAAALALVSCDKEPQGTDPSGKKDPTGKKQEVIITCGQAGTKVVGKKNELDDKVSFTWENGDYLYVKEGTLDPVYFILESGAETGKGKFWGEVSEDAGESTVFQVQWPDADPDLSNQAYVENGIKGEKMLATATRTGISKLKEEFALTPQYAVARLDLKGDAYIGTITLKSSAKDNTYALTCPTGGVHLNESTAVLFHIVTLPTEAGELTVTLSDKDGNSLGTFKSTKNDLVLEKGKVLKMGTLSLYKDGTFKSTDFNGANWYTHGSDDVNAGDFGGENW